jgi:hypothetical protein
MNKRFITVILALATTGLLAIGCGTTADIEESEFAWEGSEDLTESEPGLAAQYDETEGVIEKKIEKELMESEAPL